MRSCLLGSVDGDEVSFSKLRSQAGSVTLAPLLVKHNGGCSVKVMLRFTFSTLCDEKSSTFISFFNFSIEATMSLSRNARFSGS